MTDLTTFRPTVGGLRDLSATLLVCAATMLLASPSIAATTSECDVVDSEVVEALSMDGENNTIILDETELGPTLMAVEAFTGERYGKVYQIVIAEAGDYDIAAIFDVGGCVTQVELPPDLL